PYAGCVLAHRLASDPTWFQRPVRVVDVGLRPSHAAPFDGLLLPGGLLPEDARPLLDGAISPVERQWLAMHLLELAAIRPEQVIKRLFRAMNRDGDGDWDGGGDGDGGYVIVDERSFASDADASDGGGDSFG